MTLSETSAPPLSPPQYPDEVAIITAFGGPTRLGQLLGMGKSRISNWRVIGVPPSQHANLVELAQRERVDGISFEVLAALRKRREEARGAKASPFAKQPDVAGP